MSKYDVYSEFDIEQHKKTFINYLEVVILPDGTIKYAVPSHQEFLINYICEKWGITREKFKTLIPDQYKFSFIDWLLTVSGCVCVWTSFYKGECNFEQSKRVEDLKDAGLLKLEERDVMTFE